MQCGGSNWLRVGSQGIKELINKLGLIIMMIQVCTFMCTTAITGITSPVLLPFSGASNSNTIITLCSVIKQTPYAASSVQAVVIIHCSYQNCGWCTLYDTACSFLRIWNKWLISSCLFSVWQWWWCAWNCSKDKPQLSLGQTIQSILTDEIMTRGDRSKAIAVA